MLQKPTPKIKHPAVQLVISQLFQKLKSRSANKQGLRKFKMKLNPEKCTLGTPLGKLVGYMISQQGIDPNLEKVPTRTKMKPPESLHDIQKLMGVYCCLEQVHLMTRCQGGSLSSSSLRNRTSSSRASRHRRPSKTSRSI
jgi:hypothetical protein